MIEISSNTTRITARDFVPRVRTRLRYGKVLNRMPVYESIDPASNPSRRRTRLLGFDVIYDYAGELYSTRLPKNPGNRIALSVSIVPTDALATVPEQVL